MTVFNMHKNGTQMIADIGERNILGGGTGHASVIQKIGRESITWNNGTVSYRNFSFTVMNPTYGTFQNVNSTQIMYINFFP